jgi:drug/metabolite transporter (DMT)-like permease
MPESIPLRTKKPPTSSSLSQAHDRPRASTPSHDVSLDDSGRSSSPVVVSGLTSRQLSRTSSPFADVPSRHLNGHASTLQEPESPTESLEFDDWDEHDASMPSDLRPELEEAEHDGHRAPLLGGHSKDEDEGTENDMSASGLSRRSTHTFHERDPETQAKYETRKKYTYAAITLALSLVSFTVQTETAVYIQHQLKWEKPYCMLYMTHGSWIVLYPVMLLFLRLQNWSTPFPTFWRRHTQVLRQIALTVQHQTLHPTPRQQLVSPVYYMFKMTAFITCALTLAGGSWYVAVNQTTASDLTAIYNCSAFFAYAFSIPLLHEKLRTDKVVAVAIAIAGVFIVAYGDIAPAKHGSKSGGGTGGADSPPSHEAENRAFGNLVIGVGSVLYGFYEVLYKKLACPPEGASPNKGVVFANTFGSMIGAFTVCVLWVPLPVLHWMGWEVFELPRGEQASMMAISVLANASTYTHRFSPYIFLTDTSIFRIVSRTHQSYLAGIVLGRGAAYHLHRGDCRSVAASAA